MKPLRHWRRHLKSGGVEYFFDSGNKGTAWGAADPETTADYFQELFEKATGCKLPEPEWKPMRGKP